MNPKKKKLRVDDGNFALQFASLEKRKVQKKGI